VPLEPAEPTTPEEPEENGPPWVVTAVIRAAQSFAVIERPSTRGWQLAAIGQEIDGWTILAVLHDSVRVSSAQRIVTMGVGRAGGIR
jgi:hypothetical protein